MNGIIKLNKITYFRQEQLILFYRPESKTKEREKF